MVACIDPTGGQSPWMWVFPGKGLQLQHVWGCTSALTPVQVNL